MKIGADTRALVTGASKGIGRALSEELARRGAAVGMVARNEQELRAAAEPIGGIALPADIADAAAIERATAEFVEKAGGLNLVIANAGIARYAPFADQDLADAEQMVTINVLGTIYTARAGLDHMLNQGRGHIVVVSSGAGLRAFPGAAVYGATKAADRGFAEALRHELSGTGVSVTTVFPGEIATDLHTGRREGLPDWRKSDDELPVGEAVDATLAAVEADKRNVYVPREVRLLGLSGIAPRVVDRLLAALRGGSAAPRRD
jgi:short-subunit dehydrogenase